MSQEIKIRGYLVVNTLLKHLLKTDKKHGQRQDIYKIKYQGI
jgi:hypothetical protein